VTAPTRSVRGPIAIGLLVLAAAGAAGAVSCGSPAARAPSAPPPPTSQAGQRFCRDVHGVLLTAMNAAADDRTTDAGALTLFGAAQDAFVGNARLDDAHVAAMSTQIVRGLDGFIAVVRNHGLQQALDQHHDAFGGAVVQVDRFCG
jgi:hypothetical protein